MGEKWAPCDDPDCPGTDPCNSVGCWAEGRAGMVLVSTDDEEVEVRAYWKVGTVRLSLLERITGRVKVWIPPPRICDERGCQNGATMGGKCDLCYERLWEG